MPCQHCRRGQQHFIHSRSNFCFSYFCQISYMHVIASRNKLQAAEVHLLALYILVSVQCAKFSYCCLKKVEESVYPSLLSCVLSPVFSCVAQAFLKALLNLIGWSKRKCHSHNIEMLVSESSSCYFVLLPFIAVFECIDQICTVQIFAEIFSVIFVCLTFKLS